MMTVSSWDLATTARKQVSSLINSCSGNTDSWRQIHPDGVISGDTVGNVPDDPRQWCAFEYADLMEQGLSIGPSTSFVEAPEEEVRLLVKQSADEKEWLLTTEDDAHLLVARANNNIEGFSIFVTSGGEPVRALGPAFTLAPNRAKDKWTLCATTCDRCLSQGRRTCGSRELAQFSHNLEDIGPAKICIMDVEIPASTQDGNLDVWCPMCKGQESDQEYIELSSRRPKWNARHKALMMEFYGRCHLASPMNFQLERVDKPEKLRLLFGKVGARRFVLDYNKPLGMVQAFAAALSTCVWKAKAGAD